MSVMVWVIFVAAASLEVGGDAVTRHGLRHSQWPVILAGGLMLALYGIVVNTVRWDFSKLLGVYVAVFALISVLVGRFCFHETIAGSTWLGLGLIVLGGLVIQWGGHLG